jgi:hypothetical protein
MEFKDYYAMVENLAALNTQEYWMYLLDMVGLNMIILFINSGHLSKINHAKHKH